jgi:DNA polymerase epsilon subunit 2
LLVSAEPNDAAGGAGDDVDPSQMLKIVDAFDMPPWRWDEVRGSFEKCVFLLFPPVVCH